MDGTEKIGQETRPTPKKLPGHKDSAAVKGREKDGAARECRDCE